MATSGTTAFTLSMAQIFEEAFERAVNREMRTGHDVRTACRSYDLLTIEWQNAGYNLWTVVEATFDTVVGQSDYILPADCMDVVHVSYKRDPNNEVSLWRTSLPDFASIPNKEIESEPTHYLMIRGVEEVVMRFWPIPAGVKQVKIWYTRRIEDAGRSSNTPDIPMRFLPALIAGLAYKISIKMAEGRPNTDFLKAEYAEAFEIATQEDRDKASAMVVPRRGRL